MSKSKIGWHILGAPDGVPRLGFNDRRLVVLNEPLGVSSCVPQHFGLHACSKLADALLWSWTGEAQWRICKVVVGNPITVHDNKMLFAGLASISIDEFDADDPIVRALIEGE